MLRRFHGDLALRQLIHRHSVDLGLPLFFLTRFSAAWRFGRLTTRSIRSLAPERSSPFVAVGNSSLRLALGASPLLSTGSSSYLDSCGRLPSAHSRLEPGP
jgi:hypothetical protein